METDFQNSPSSSDTPTFAEPYNETLELTPNTNVTLNCKATGNPSPLYSWRFAPSTQVEMQNHDGIMSILTPEESGIYSCTASNELGQTTKHFTVLEAKGNPLSLIPLYSSSFPPWLLVSDF